MTALGKKLFLSLFVLARMGLKRLPEDNRLKRWRPGGWCHQGVSGPAETAGVVDGA